jgi:hypothetical protein
VWAFTKDDAGRLAEAGYDVAPVDLTVAQCGPGTRTFRAWHATRPAKPPARLPAEATAR